MANEFNFARAEQMLMDAQSALGAGPVKAASRLGLFVGVTHELELSIAEVKRLGITRVQAIREAVDDLRLLIADELDAATQRHTKLSDAIADFKENVVLKRPPGIPNYLWSPKDDNGFHAAVEKLFLAHLGEKP